LAQKLKIYKVLKKLFYFKYLSCHPGCYSFNPDAQDGCAWKQLYIYLLQETK